MTEDARRQMNASKSPAFVADVIEALCDICAVGHESYVIDEAEENARAKKSTRPNWTEKYGNCDPLRLRIVACLRSVG